jgi:hypothetical protein
MPRTSLRLPSESNPWSVDPPSAILAAEKPPPVIYSSASVSPAVPTPKTADTWAITSPKREGSGTSSWNTNPWGDESLVGRGLGELSLEDVKKRDEERAAARARDGAAGKEPTAAKSKEDDDKALLAAAMGGDSRSWDPLGAV